MAKEMTPEAAAAEAEKKRLKEEKKQLKKEQKEQKRDTKRRAKEISKQEEELSEDEDGNGLVTFFATILIVVLWLAVVCVIVKLDIGGFGSSVLTPILKDVPVVNRILPGDHQTETSSPDSFGGYSSLQEAVDYIKQLELELERVQNASAQKDVDLDALKSEVLRLQEFEARQTEFQRIETEFYEEVVYAENAPGAEEYRKWYEEINPTTAEFLYKQAITQRQESQEILDYAQAYSEMKPKQAAAIFEEMTDNLDLAAKILKTMNADDRGAILGVMDAEVAAKLTKIMNPDS